MDPAVNLYLLRRGRNRQLRLQRRQLRDHINAFELPEARFLELFRFPQQWVLHILDEINVDDYQRTSRVPYYLRFLATLNFFATGSYQRTVGEDFNIALSQTIISRSVEEVSTQIQNTFLQTWVKFPTTAEECNKVKERFMEKSQFPGVIGAIDCTHIKILKPDIEEHNYVNRKGYHSKNVQIIGDADCRILSINARYGGSAHDSFIWRNSIIRTHLKEKYDNGARGSWLLGDSGYPLEPWLMTPILNAVPGSPEERYTNRHVRCRVAIERLNGIFKAVFRCLGGDRSLRYSPQKVGTIINACAVLHNMRLHLRLLDEEAQEVNDEDQRHPVNNVCDGQILQEARRIRDEIVQNLE